MHQNFFDCFGMRKCIKIFGQNLELKAIVPLSMSLDKELVFGSYINPSIAQLVERRTVKERMQISLGHWFKSGSRENFLKIILSTY